MRSPLELYRSADAFVHNVVDGLGMRLDEEDRSSRSRVALFATAASFVPFIVGVWSSDRSLFSVDMAYGFYAGLEARLSYGEMRDAQGVTVHWDGRQRFDEVLQNARLVPAAAGAGTALYGIGTLIDGTMRGAPDASSVSAIGYGMALLWPALSTYLRDRGQESE